MGGWWDRRQVTLLGMGCSQAGKGQPSSSGAGWLPSQLEQCSRSMARDSYRCLDKKS